MVIKDIEGKTLFLDTAPLIYFIEGHSVYQPALQRLFEANDRKYFSFITSSITLLEVLVQPLRLGRLDVVDQYKKILTETPNIDIFGITNNIAVKAAGLRAQYNLKTPDALQLATALEYGADHFLTNDLRLQYVKDIPIIKLEDLQ